MTLDLVGNLRGLYDSSSGVNWRGVTEQPETNMEKMKTMKTIKNLKRLKVLFIRSLKFADTIFIETINI